MILEMKVCSSCDFFIQSFFHCFTEHYGPCQFENLSEEEQRLFDQYEYEQQEAFYNMQDEMPGLQCL
jgi:hypothetical protein